MAVAGMYPKLGFKDVLNKSIVDQKYKILSKKDAATASKEAFVKHFTDMSVEDTQSVFNLFFQLDCK